MKENLFENEYVKFWIHEEILCSNFKGISHMNVEIAEKIINLRLEISGNKRHYWCLDLSGIKTVDKAIYDYIESLGQKQLIACGLIVNSYVLVFLVNIFLKFRKYNIPIKMFKDKSESLNWLKELQESSKFEYDRK